MVRKHITWGITNGVKIGRVKISRMALARDQNIWLLMAAENKRPAMQRTQCSLVLHMVSEHLFMAFTKHHWKVRVSERHQWRKAESFKGTTWLNA